MSSSDDLWNAFKVAGDGLICDLKAFFNGGVDCNLLQQNPKTRNTADSSIDNMLSTLHRILSDVQRVKAEVLKTERLIIRSIGRVHMLRSPIGTLPTELIHYILTHHLNLRPENHKEIVHISSVCSLWQDIIHNQHGLFSKADWMIWPQSISETWTSRTKGGPLTISLDETVKELPSNSLPLLLREPRLSGISAAAQYCTVLIVKSFPASSARLNCAFLKALEFPILEFFKVHVEIDRGECNTLFTLTAPNLRELDVTNAGVVLSGPSPQLSTFQFSFESGRYPSDAILEVSLKLCRENRVATLRLHGAALLDSFGPDVAEPIQTVQSLEIADFDGEEFSDWIQVIAWENLRFPIVSELRLFFGAGQRLLDEDIQTLVSITKILLSFTFRSLSLCHYIGI